MISQEPNLKNVVLTATSKDGSILEFELAPNQGVFVGSSMQCGLQLNDEGLGGIHCRIAIEDGALTIQNWMSASGILVNGHLVTSKTELHPRDVIFLGKSRIDISCPVGRTPNRGQEEIESRLDRFSAPLSQTSIDTELTEQHDGVGHLPLEPDTDSRLDSASLSTVELCESDDGDVDDYCEDSIETIDSTGIDPSLTRVDEELESLGLELDLEDLDNEELYDAETVALLRAEIDELQSALAQRDADAGMSSFGTAVDSVPPNCDANEDSALALRMQELIEEANRSDERAALLEEMLYASEETNRWEKEERVEIESWVNDIERRLGEREDEHAAVTDALQQRIKESEDQAAKLRQRLRRAANSGNAPQQYEETLENLQANLRDLREELETTKNRAQNLEKQLEQVSSEQDKSLREQRASLAQEQAKTSRLRFELADKLSALEQLPKPQNQEDNQTNERIRALREHLREIHEEELKKEKESTLTTRLAKLWKRVEY